MLKKLSFRHKFGLGMIGAVAPLVARYYVQDTGTLDLIHLMITRPGEVLGFLLLKGLMVVIGGVVACIIVEKEPWKIFVAGVTAPALILSLSLPAASQPIEELYRNPTTLGIVVAEQVKAMAGYPGMVEGESPETIGVLRWNNIIPAVGSYDLAEENSRWFKVLFERRNGVITEGWVLGRRMDEVYLSVREPEQLEFDDLLFRFNIRAGPPHPGTSINASEKSFVKQIFDGVQLSLGRRTGPWFVIGGSHRSYEDAERQVRLIDTEGLKERGLDVKLEIYEYVDGFGYAVTLGGYLTEERAVTLRDMAIKFGFPRDTYLWSLESRR